MTGDPTIVFNRKYFYGLFSGLAGDCTLTSISDYDKANGEMSVEYSYLVFINESVCSNLVTPQYLGYNSNYDFDRFKTVLDVSTAMLCIAVNSNVVDFHDLDKIPGMFYR
jgi:hypothetical protein